MAVGGGGGDAAAGRALEEAELEQVRLVDVHDRVRLLADEAAMVSRPTGPPPNFSMMQREDAVVDLVEAEVVDVEAAEGLARRLAA